MTVETDQDQPEDTGAFAALADRARAAWIAADTRLTETVGDLHVTDDARLDDRTRARLMNALSALVDGVEATIRIDAARRLAQQGLTTAAEALLTNGQQALPRLLAAGLLRDPALMEEVIAHVRLQILAELLPTDFTEADAPSLVVRLSELADQSVAVAARALLVADSRSRDIDSAPILTAEIQHGLGWRVAAAIRGAGPDADADRALVHAVQAMLAAHDESKGSPRAAERLAGAIDARADELPALLLESLGDQRPWLFVAVLAQASRVDADQVRAALIWADDERLWLLLRAVGLDRTAIAHIAVALAEADPKRDIERFADGLDALLAISPDEARHALSPFTLHRDMQAAMRALARGER